jgi:hypothetical protein
MILLLIEMEGRLVIGLLKVHAMLLAVPSHVDSDRIFSAHDPIMKQPKNVSYDQVHRSMPPDLKCGTVMSPKPAVQISLH